MRAHEDVGGEIATSTNERLVVAARTRSRVRPCNALKNLVFPTPDRGLGIARCRGTAGSVQYIEPRHEQAVAVSDEVLEGLLARQNRVVLGENVDCWRIPQGGLCRPQYV